MWLDGKLGRIDKDLCKDLDDPNASLKLIEDFYRRVVVNALGMFGAPDAALLLERSLDEETTPYQVTWRLGRELMEVPDHKARLKEQERIWLADLEKTALSMWGCGGAQEFEYESPPLPIKAYKAGETVNVRFAMGPHTAWFTWRGTIERDWSCDWRVRGTLDRDVADYSDWHGDPHDYDGDGVKECPEGACGKTASFDLPAYLLAPGQTNTRITIPDDWMARLVVAREASYPGFGIYFNTRQWFWFTVTDWSSLPTIKYRFLLAGDRFRDPAKHEIEPGYAPPP